MGEVHVYFCEEKKTYSIGHFKSSEVFGLDISSDKEFKTEAQAIREGKKLLESRITQHQNSINLS